jgi:hypothetical protein
METDNSIYLQLGDIIQIDAPSNLNINQHNYLIDFIDSKKIKIIDEVSGDTIQLNINDNGNLSDESITSISILNRDEKQGYARQNNLLPDTFIDIHFGGDLPIIITGQITNLEEDMIEIKTIDNNELIYIDFGFKGIPENIPINKIVIRPPPELIKSDKTDDNTNDIIDDSNVIEDLESIDQPSTIEIPTESIKHKLKDIILDADQIVFGPTLGTFTQITEVPEERKRYSMDNQVNDLLDELLSSIPSHKRTRLVLNNIHIQIERFKQLREKFSVIDNNGNSIIPPKKGGDYKPLVQHLQKLNQKLYWILPVAQNQKKLYDIDVDIDSQESIPDVIELTLANIRTNEYDIREMYKSNTDNYTTYMRKLNPYLTPFNTIEYNDTLAIKEVNDNIEAVMDNLNDLYSSVASNEFVKSKKYLITKYNLGLNKLQPSHISSTSIKSHLVNLTANDSIAIKSFLTLPAPVMTFSNINLPATNIYDKSNLNRHFISYWNLFRENMKYKNQYIENLNTNIEFDEKNYLKDATQYLLSKENNDPDKYEKYLNVIIPKTKILFNLIKKHITGKLSLVSVVNYLQPFLIYLEDISFKQYDEINGFITDKILDYKKEFYTNKDTFALLSKNILKFQYESILFKILKGKLDLSTQIIDKYGFDDNYKYKGVISTDYILSESEILKKMMHLDFTLSYNTLLSIVNIDLFSPFDFDTLLEQKEKEFSINLKKENVQNECKNFVLSKRYIDLNELLEDNNTPVYFDKKYDTTVYDIIAEYQLEQSQMDENTFKSFLIDKLVQNIGLNREDAKYESTSMIDGKRKVINDQYAVLEIDNIDSVKYFYYKRENDMWVKDESIPENSFFGTNDLFCNINKKCIDIDNTCADTSYAAELVRKDILKQMSQEFDTEYDENLTQFKKYLDTKLSMCIDRLSKLKIINKYRLYKYERKQLDYARNTENIDTIISPYEKIRDIILGQSDIIKRNTNIITFVNKSTRPYNENLNESQYWLYCVDTNQPLLPTFLSTLASVFILNDNYTETLNSIKKEQGVNIDNITWCKYTGYMIEKIALNTDEDYEESGYKRVSREILESDAGSALLQSATIKQPDFLSNPKAKLVNNVITVISQKIGLILDKERETIINHVILALDKTVDCIEVFEEKQKIKKKKQKYEDVFNASLLTFTLAYISVFISVAIPSLQSKKTFPGCKKSLQGYPVTGEEDLTNLEYISCIAASIESKSYPWKALPKNKDKIKLSLKKTFDAFILKQSEIQSLIEQKKNYLLQTDDDIIPIELDIKKWINFLPPLQEIVNKTPSNLSTEFRNSLRESIKTGSKKQFEQLNVINSKLIYFSMAIIHSINTIVKQEKLLLTNNNNVPFLQNACCNTGDFITINYFINKDKNISNYNDIVNYLYNIQFDLINMGLPGILLDPNNTKLKFAPLTNEFSEDTIYKAFIHYCNFNNNIPINNNLLPICINKPDEFDKNASIKSKIDSLKKEGQIYSIETFNELILQISKTNIVKLDLIHTDKSNIQQLRDLIAHMKDRNNPIGDKFLTLFSNILDSYNISSETNDDTRTLKNFLAAQREIYKNNITDFINKFASQSKREKNKMIQCMNNIMKFNTIGNEYFMSHTDETSYKAIQFVKNSIFSFIFIIPNIIINKVDYQSIKIATHWKLSDAHTKDIKYFIKQIYEPLRQYYNESTIIPLLNKNQELLTDVFKLIELTNLYANIITINNKEISSILDTTLIDGLFEFYFLYVINTFIDNTNDLSLISTEPIHKSDISDIITTSVEVEEEITGEITEIDILKGQQKSLNEKMASLLVTILDVICKEKDKINLNKGMIKEKINRAKDKERHKITSTLKNMDKEDRQIEHLFKNHRLERWNKGQQKGLTQYVAKTYDEERAEREADEIMERIQEEKELLGQAITADRDIARLEHAERLIVEDRIERDVYSLEDIPEDDEFAENIDDSYRLQFDDNEE